MRRLAPCLLLAGCCGQEPPEWLPLPAETVDGGTPLQIDLRDALVDDKQTPTVTATPGEGLEAQVDGTTLTLTATPGFEGYTSVALLATDACGNEAETNLTVEVVDNPDTTVPEGCGTTFTWTGSASSVAVAGTFNDWDASDTLTDNGDGTWSVTLDLPPGAYPYKFVADGAWSCDPDATLVHCDDGQELDLSCTPNGNACNSMVVVPECGPVLTVTALEIDRDANALSVSGSASSTPTGTWATLDGEPVEAWTGSTFSFTTTDLSDGRHVFRAGADDAEPVYVPFWTDDVRWDQGLLYFVFVDRFEDGDTSLDVSEGADVDYVGGDWAGVVDRLDWLEALGVTTIWLTAPQDNAEGAWDGDCGATYSGYHGYWPDSDGLEEHFGDADALHALIEGAHARNMRVMVDWVANHVHEDHTWYAEHPEWFNDRYICEEDEDGDGVDNWTQRTETCWFASYLPDIDYTEAEPLALQVDAAIDFAKEYEIDGYRVDAVKHVPHSVPYDLQARIRTEIEHTDAGGDEDFRTIGETFDGYSTIAEYVNEHELDAQYDFPLYWSTVAAFARDEVGLSNGDGSLAASLATSESSYGGAVMGTFLGNHDVSRFIAHASGEVSSLYGDGVCGDDGWLRDSDTAPGWSEPYDRLMLAWTFLLTTEGLPLVYYGDEIGLPGYGDPDNRQPMRFEGELSADEERVLEHVRTLGQARLDHPAFARGTRTTWWENEADVWAYARYEGEDAVLVVLNRGDAERTLTNGLAYAGLPEGTWTDVLTGDTFASSGDSLSVTVPGVSARVLVPQ